MEGTNLQTLISWWLVAVVISGLLWGLDWAGRLGWMHWGADVVFNPPKEYLSGIKADVYQKYQYVQYWRQGQQELWLLRKHSVDAAKMESELQRLQQENEALRKLLGAPLQSNWKFLPGRIIGYDDDGWRINRGSEHGVHEGMAVLADNLLIGKVTVVENLHSYVLAVDSPDASWEVEIRSAEKNAVAGNGLLKYKDGTLFIERILPNETVTPGDLVVTKGVQGILPGIPVGKLAAIETPEDSAVYQRARIWWPLSRELVKDVAIIYQW